jgi:hypothetical protein
MASKNNIFRNVVAGLCIAFAAATSFAADPYTLVAEDEISLQKIKTIFDAAIIKISLFKDDKLKIEDSGFKTIVKINSKKKLITYFSAWRMKKDVPEIKKLQFVNKLNDELIFVRFSMPRPTTLWCDYQFKYEGGITPFQIVNNYKLFARVTKGAVTLKDTDNIVGSD